MITKSCFMVPTYGDERDFIDIEDGIQLVTDFFVFRGELYMQIRAFCWEGDMLGGMLELSQATLELRPIIKLEAEDVLNEAQGD